MSFEGNIVKGIACIIQQYSVSYFPMYTQLPETKRKDRWLNRPYLGISRIELMEGQGGK